MFSNPKFELLNLFSMECNLFAIVIRDIRSISRRIEKLETYSSRKAKELKLLRYYFFAILYRVNDRLCLRSSYSLIFNRSS